jgi:hypothetical protein
MGIFEYPVYHGVLLKQVHAVCNPQLESRGLWRVGERMWGMMRYGLITTHEVVIAVPMSIKETSV